jgi:hypothetical protein
MSGMGRYVDVRPIAKKVLEMAGVVNSCTHCHTTVYDEETTAQRCPSCKRSMWLPHHIADIVEAARPDPAGYHLKRIPQGAIGELSKLLEEIHEALDAEEQGNPIMVLAELSDLYGAMELYLAKHHPTFTMKHLANMAEATHRAFTTGRRKRKQATS